MDITCDHNNLLSILDKQAKEQPKKTIFIMLDAQGKEIALNYAMLEKKAKRLAAFLQLQQLEEKTVLLIYTQSLDFIIAFFACLYAKAIPVPAFPPVSISMAKRFSHIIENSNIQLILSNSIVMQHMNKMKILSWGEKIPLLKNISHYLSHGVSSFLGAGLNLPWVDTSLIQEDSNFSYNKTNINSNDIALIQYTSGSLGDPKGVIITHANLMANEYAINRTFAPTQDSICFGWLPMFHDMGLIGNVLQCLYSDSLYIFMSPQDFIVRPGSWLKYISKYRATYSGGPNFAYQICANKSAQIDEDELDLSCWTTAYCGAEYINSKTLEDFYKIYSKYGFKKEAFLPCYGIAEATLMTTGNIKNSGITLFHADQNALKDGKIVAVNTKRGPGKKIKALVSCGKVVSGTELIVVSKDRKVLGECQIGEIWLKGKNISQGYFNNERATNEFFKCYTHDGLGPYFKTGDLGFVYNNELYITGRCKDLIIIAGKNFSPQDIERTCEYAHISIRKGSVAAFSHTNGRGETLHIALEIYNQTKKSSFETIFRSLQSALSEEHQVSAYGIYLLSEGGIIKTSSGKISRLLTKKSLLNNTLPIRAKQYNKTAYNDFNNTLPVKRAPAKKGHLAQENEIKTFLIQNINELLNRKLQKDEETVTFSHLGLDSFSMMKLVGAIEAFTKKQLDPGILNNYPTINKLSNYLKTHVITTSEHANNQVSPLQGSNQYKILTFKEWQQNLIENKIYTVEAVREGGPLPSVTLIRDSDERMDTINFTTQNYLGYATHPEVTNAAQEALRDYGLGICDPPVAIRKLKIHKMFEDDLTNFFNVSDKSVSLFSSGDSALAGVINAYMQDGGMIFLDEKCHAGLVEGAKTSGATYQFFKHNDMTHLEQLLEKNSASNRHTLVCVEGLYSTEGDFGHIKDTLALCHQYDSKLLVDEAHSILMAGTEGQGISAEQGVLSQVDFLIGSLSEGFSATGGFVFCHSDYAHYIDFYTRNRMIACTLSPAVIGGVAKILKLAQTTEGKNRQQRLHHNCNIFHSLLRENQIATTATDTSWIVVIPVGTQKQLVEIGHDLQKQGLNVELVGYPFTPLDHTRLRLFISSEHTTEHFQKVISTLKPIIGK